MAKIFVGGSVQSLPLVREIEVWLSAAHTVETWVSPTFFGGDYPLEHLQGCASSFDAAVFAFCDEDREVSDSESSRDKTLAELGLFVGTHGRRRVIVCWQGRQRPNDLPGITYVDANQDKLETARRKLERWAAELGTQPKPKVFRQGGEAAEVLKFFPVESYKIALQRSRFASILDLYIPYDGHMELIQSDLVQMLERAGTSQVLLCDPRSAACQAGQVALQSLGIDVSAEIDRSLRHLATIHRQLPEMARAQLELRLYTSLPSLAIYRTDDIVTGAAHYHNVRAIDAAQLRVATAGSWLGERLLKQHREVWEDPSTRRVSLSDIEPLPER